MKAIKKVLVGLIAATVLILAGCPTPFEDVETGYETSATIDTARMVFIEEDGTETPLLSVADGGPEEIVDFAVVDDGGSARSADSGNRVRAVILGRRAGRIYVWAFYRYGGMLILSNEEGEDELLEMVAEESWGLEGWEYDSENIFLSDDGKVIIGQHYRPDGWEFDDKLGDVPEPEIGVWWNLFEKECTDECGEVETRLVVSRARPMILMEEPVDSVARCSDGGAKDNYYWIEKFRRWIIEKIASAILDFSWNYMADVSGFVESDDVEGGIPEGYYVASGVDRYGVESWAWFTPWSMEDIVEAPEEPVGNTAPNDLTGFIPGDLYYSYPESQETRVMVDPAIADPANDPVDPDGDTVTYILDPAGNPIPGEWSFDEDTGILTFPANVSARTVPTTGLTLTFYTVDSGGLESNRVDLTLIFVVQPGS